MPVIPMVLVNGSEGIGTGWSCTIQNHDPREIIDNIRKMITGEEPEEMHPHFYGYTGEVSFHCLIFHSFRGRNNSHLSTSRCGHRSFLNPAKGREVTS
jgi:hypothetical protein